MSRKEKRPESRESTAVVPISGGLSPAVAGSVLPPWPEWSDSEVNSERWDQGIGGTPAKSKGDKLKTATPGVGTQGSMAGGFEDPLGHCDLPPSLEVASWRRPKDLPEQFEVVREQLAPDVEFDLAKNNVHLLHSAVMREIIAGIMNLYHYAEIAPFHTELESGNFSPTGGQIWRPWHHVYSCCKVGKGQVHKPVVNPSGKYIVRLYFMGSWRRITVDDFLPVDKYKRILLPTTLHSELWPMILAKALLKVSRLTWRRCQEVVDFSVVTCLTGWLMHQVDCYNIPYITLWQICQKVLMADDPDVTNRYGYSEDNVVSERHTSLRKNYSSCIQDDKKLIRDYQYMDVETNPDHEVLGKVVMFGVMRDLVDIPEELADVGPCVAHSVLLSEARVFFLGEYGDGSPFPLWKVFRWKAWAIKKGIIKDIKDINMKSVRLFAPLRKCIVPECEVLKVESEVLNVVEDSTTTAQAGQGDGLKSKESKKKGGSKGSVKEKKVASSKASKGSKKSTDGGSKTSTKSKGKGKGKSDAKNKDKPIEIELKPNNDSWMDIYLLTKYMSSLQIFYRPSCFAHQEKVTDVWQIGQVTQPVEKPQTSKRSSTKDSSSPSVTARTPVSAVKPRKSTNECFYLLIDSPTCKKLLFTLCVVPYCAIDDLTNVMNRFHKFSHDNLIPENTKKLAYLTAEIYKWRSIKEDTHLFSMSTCGTNSMLVQLGEGLQVLRVWCKVPQNHMLQISSQTPFFIGSKERVQDTLATSSESLNYYAMEMFNKFSDLATSVCDSPENTEALSAFHLSFMPLCVQTTHHVTLDTAQIFGLGNAARIAFERAVVKLLYSKLMDHVDLFTTALLELQNWFQNKHFGVHAVSEISTEFSKAIEAAQFALEQNAQMEALYAATQDNNLLNSNSSTIKKKTGGKNKKGADDKKSKGKPDSKKNESKDKRSKSSSQGGKQGKGKGTPTANITSHHILFQSPQDSTKILQLMLESEPRLLKYYPFRNDFDLNLVYSDYKGVTKVSANQDWIPLVRYIVNIDHTRSAFNEIDLQTNLPSAVLRVIDNDTLVELPRVTRHECKYKFVRNEYGYTLFAYGFNEPPPKPKEHTWKLRCIADNKSDILHHCGGTSTNNAICTSALPPPRVSIHEVSGYYLPNRTNNIFRTLLTVSTQQFFSFRISFNRPNVEYIFTISYDETMELSFGLKCLGNVVIPSVQLFPRRDMEGKLQTTIFQVEAEIINDSWPLDDNELSVVTALKERAKTSMLIYTTEEPKAKTPPAKKPSKKLSQSSVSSGRKSPTRNVSMHELETNSPKWMVQIVVDDEHAAGVILDVNRRKAEEVRRLKANWEKDDPGRHKRATKLREDYISRTAQEYIEGSVNEEFLRMVQELFRASKRWVNLGAPLPTASLATNNQQSEWTIMTEDHVKELQETYLTRSDEFEQEHSRLTDGLEKMNTEQRRIHDFTFFHYDKQRKKSREILDNAYENRDAYVRMEMAKLVPKDTKKKDKGKKDKAGMKDKTDKKDKKGKGDAASNKSKKK